MPLSRYLLVGITGLSMSLLLALSPTSGPEPMPPSAKENSQDTHKPAPADATTSTPPLLPPPSADNTPLPSPSSNLPITDSSVNHSNRHLSLSEPTQSQTSPSKTLLSKTSLSDTSPSDTSPPCALATIKTQSGSIARPSSIKYVQTSGNRVRMRVAPQLDAPVVRELDKAIPLEVTGETDDFYAVRPPYPLKAYVFRTYILDNKIEGERVNVRLEPSPQGTIVTQLSTGAPATGTPSTKNPKWLEIDLPPSVRFYISRDYATAIEPSKYQELSKELDKPFPKPQVAQATVKASEKASDAASTSTLSKWEQKELELQARWLKEHEGLHAKAYATFQTSQAQTIQGQLELYEAPSYAPGDFIICQGERIVAIVYSAKVNLMNYKDAGVSVQAVPRDRQGFAYPTYCVLSIERTTE